MINQVKETRMGDCSFEKSIELGQECYRIGDYRSATEMFIYANELSKDGRESILSSLYRDVSSLRGRMCQIGNGDGFSVEDAGQSIVDITNRKDDSVKDNVLTEEDSLKVDRFVLELCEIVLGAYVN